MARSPKPVPAGALPRRAASADRPGLGEITELRQRLVGLGYSPSAAARLAVTTIARGEIVARVIAEQRAAKRA